MKIPVATIYLRFPLSGNEEKGYTVKTDQLGLFVTEFEEAMSYVPGQRFEQPDEYIIKFHEMEESELDDMGEWEGW